jgi:PAS domain S-box-containing protein
MEASGKQLIGSGHFIVIALVMAGAIGAVDFWIELAVGHRKGDGSEAVYVQFPWRDLLLLMFLLIFGLYAQRMHNRVRQVSEGLTIMGQALEQAGEAVIITDHRGTIEYVNPAFTRISGYSFDEACGQNPSILKSEAQDKRLYEQLWATIRQGDIWHGALIDRRKDGSYYPVLSTIAPIRGESGVITHYVSMQQDISERKQLEEELNQAKKLDAVGTLVGGIAHDFNNILAGILGNSFLAKEELAHSRRGLESIHNIEMLGMRAAETIKQLLMFARRDVVEMRDEALHGLVAESIKAQQVDMKKTIHLHLECRDEALAIHGDRSRLQLVLISMLGNACDAVRDVERAEIICRIERFHTDEAFCARHPDIRQQDLARISICDNGVGIEADKLDKIFEPFFTTKGIGAGTGLGLAMSYGAIKRHGGCIEVESTPGEGSAFHIYLPLSAGRANSADVEFRHELLRGEGETVLLVDDESHVCEIGHLILKHLGYRVLVAESGEQAVDLYR